MAAFGPAATRRLLRTAGPRILEAWAAGAQHVADILDTTALTTGNRVARSYLRSRRLKLVGVNRESSNLVKSVIASSINQGQGIGAQRRLLADMFGSWSRGRSLTVARTENGTAWGTASHEQERKDKVKSRTWLTSRDDRVRDSHRIDGQCQALEAMFTLANGAQLLYPLDPAGGAREVINCRCTTAPRVQGCDEGRQWATAAARAAEWRRQIAAQLPGERALRQWIRGQWILQQKAFLARLPKAS